MPRLPEHGSVPEYVRVAQYWEQQRQDNPLMTTYSYGDLLIIPDYSDLKTIDEVSTRTELAEGFPLEIPIVSSNMGSVTESTMAILMARLGGIGIIHRAMSIEDQVTEVKKVKDATKYVVEDPPLVTIDTPVGAVRAIMEERKRGFVLVLDNNQNFAGMISKRDVDVETVPASLVSVEDPAQKVMIPKEKIVIAPPGISMQVAKEIMYKNRIEKLPLFDSEGNFGGVITSHDIRMIEKYPQATMDSFGRLRVGAAIGIQEDAMDRALALVEAGVDILVIDVLHGDSKTVTELSARLNHDLPNLIKTLDRLGKKITVPKIVGNICTGRAAKRLRDAGADVSKDGYGDGAVCTTRVETSTGRGQATAVIEASAAVYEGDDEKTIHKINADGSVRTPGHATMGLACGATTVMIGTYLAGTTETPGEIFTDSETGERYKEHYGNASKRGQNDLAKARGVKAKGRSPQGIETRIVYKGDAEPLVKRLIDGIKSAMANTGARNLKEFRKKVRFEIQPPAVQNEGEPHFQNHGHRR